MFANEWWYLMRNLYVAPYRRFTHFIRCSRISLNATISVYYFTVYCPYYILNTFSDSIYVHLLLCREYISWYVCTYMYYSTFLFSLFLDLVMALYICFYYESLTVKVIQLELAVLMAETTSLVTELNDHIERLLQSISKNCKHVSFYQLFSIVIRFQLITSHLIAYVTLSRELCWRMRSPKNVKQVPSFRCSSCFRWSGALSYWEEGCA